MQEPRLDAPIPGMSLTHELGARPWQSPSKNSTVEGAIESYLPAFSDETLVDQFVHVLESEIPVATIAEAMMLGGVLQGRHTIDVGILIIPFLMEAIAYIGDVANIDYDMGTALKAKEKVDMAPPTDQEIAVALKRLEGKTPMETKEVEKPIDEPVEEPMGLMARRA